MLVLTRKIGEAVLVDPDYRIEVLGISDGVARIELTTGPRLTGRPTRRLLTLRKEQGVSLPVNPHGAADTRCEVVCCGVYENGAKVRLGFEAPRQVGVLRAEIADEDADTAAADRAIGSVSDLAADLLPGGAR